MSVYSGIFDKQPREKRTDFFSGTVFNIRGIQGKWHEYAHPSFTAGIYTSQPTASACYFQDEYGNFTCGDVAIYNRDTLINALHISDLEITDIQLVAEAYNTWGRECPKHINGDFTFAIWDVREKKLFCARDPLGQRQLYFYDSRDYFIFSNNIQVLSGFSFAKELDETWIIQHLQNYHYSRDSTIFKNIRSVLPAHYITVSRDVYDSPCYWKLDNRQPQHITGLENALNEFREHLEKAIASRLAGYKQVGVELSGGIDSSVVAALAQKSLSLKGGSVMAAFSNTLPRVDTGIGDEWPKSSQVVSYLGIKEHCAVDHSVFNAVEDLSKILDCIGQPTSVAISVSHANLYEHARQKKIDLLLSGFGGDQMVTANTKGIYTFSLVKEKKILELQKYLRKYSSGYIKSWLVTAIILRDYILGIRDERKRNGLDSNWTRLLLKEEWLTPESKNRFFERPHRGTYLTVKEKTALALHKPSLMQRLETGYQLTTCYGFAYLYPLLDIPLIEFYHSLEDRWKADHQHGRAIIRQVMQNDLPAGIIDQSKGGIGVPYLKLEEEQRLNALKEWCLALPLGHDLYNYIDRDKLLMVVFGNSIYTSRIYHYLSAAVMLAMFLDRRKKVKFQHV